jgi:hypothetical protein|tara:strand:- start:314 stop:559 length:246 start_codon:yes stop_codon:yes gene_type:complete
MSEKSSQKLKPGMLVRWNPNNTHASKSLGVVLPAKKGYHFGQYGSTDQFVDVYFDDRWLRSVTDRFAIGHLVIIGNVGQEK